LINLTVGMKSAVTRHLSWCSDPANVAMLMLKAGLLL